MKSFSAHGKLLLTGEYLVLHGATALALPTKLGQSMAVETTLSPSLQWNASTPSGHWFSATIHPETLEAIATDDPGKAAKLCQILQAVRKLNPSAFQQGLRFETHLEFNTDWGLGSSSTLLSLLSQWAKVNPYELLKMTMGGSGYDIACATAESPVFYYLDEGNPVVRTIDFTPPFSDNLYFVYQGKKQHSSEEVKSFEQRVKDDDYQGDIAAVSEISEALPNIANLDDFRRFMEIHEDLLAHCLDRKPVKTQFPDFEGSMKSLGAWGGDFLLAATELPFEEVCNYFKTKGLTTIFKYQDLIL